MIRIGWRDWFDLSVDFSNDSCNVLRGYDCYVLLLGEVCFRFSILLYI
jgi:hypothetical protein